ncbi:trypsin, alkaline A-like [Ostrinia furnacalis]|uniref:trypsin, alkaline A-like n=1 Tax=Ostrinia furnacalis TaxID=93504 RepID=UPI00103CB6A6|nr:trypsin, alkaline A-like [Ostrinia furnacalis]
MTSGFVLVCFGIVFLNGVDMQFYRVVGGLPTTIDQYPIIAQLLLDVWGTQNFIQHCAGVILTTRHVISTAHCFQFSPNTGLNYSQPKFWKIRVGSSYRTRGGSLYNLKTIIPHEAFDKNFYTNDIAVLVLSKQIKLNSNVKQSTIIRPNVEVKPYSLCTLVGWGTEEVGGPQPNQLHHTAILTVDQTVCRDRYSTINAVIADSMMCAGRLDVGGIDGCFGDSGGPLIYRGIVVGLVSFGYSCGDPYFPGVYTKLSKYTNWIVKTVAANKT